MTYPNLETSASSGMSFVSSDPEGFVLAFVKSSSSMQPYWQSSSLPSNPSSVPEGTYFRLKTLKILAFYFQKTDFI